MSTQNITHELTEAANVGGKRMTTLGVIAIILGILALLAPGITGISIAFLLGFLVLGGGILRMLWAFQSGSLGQGILKFALGGLTLACGLALVGNPLFASGVLTVVLALYFIFDGLSEIVAGFGRGVGSGGGWLLFGGVISILLGGMLWAQFPLSGAWAMGILVGIKLFCIGLIMVTGGSAVRQLAKE